MLLAYLNELKKESKKSLQNIADGCDMPLSTVSRIFSGDTANPTFNNIMSIVTYLGGSLDELAGISSQPLKKEEKSMYERIIAWREKNIEEKDAQIKKLEATVESLEKKAAKKDRIILTLVVICFALAIVLAIYPGIK